MRPMPIQPIFCLFFEAIANSNLAVDVPLLSGFLAHGPAKGKPVLLR